MSDTRTTYTIHCDRYGSTVTTHKASTAEAYARAGMKVTARTERHD